MPDVRFVCLSDLHFGAENSLLTHLVGTSPVPDPTAPSSVLCALVAGLADLIDRNEDTTRRPTLILNGDIVELALASDEVALMAFERFIELAFVEHDLFDHRVIYLPGNHDHHLWETARERQYAAYVRHRSTSEPLEPPWHATGIVSDQDPKTEAERRVRSGLLEAVARRHQLLSTVEFEIRYPSFGLGSGDGRFVAFHHGHLLEPIYTVMTRLRHVLFPASPDGLDVWDFEAENFAWIDFLWSTLGRSGPWGKDVGLLYDMLQDPTALRAVSDNIAEEGAAAMAWKIVPQRVRLAALRAIMHKVADHVWRSERSSPDGPLSATARDSLTAFINGPLRRQISAFEPLPANLTFVFGHTHKPFAAPVPLSPNGPNAGIYNTGGWVVDTLEQDTGQGASAVVVDEDLNVAAIRLYTQGGAPVSIEAAGSDTEANPLRDRLRNVVNPTAAPWADLTKSVSSATDIRYQALRLLIDQGVSQARAR